MPFENSLLLPIPAPALALAGGALFAWTKTVSRVWLIIAIVAASSGIF